MTNGLRTQLRDESNSSASFRWGEFRSCNPSLLDFRSMLGARCSGPIFVDPVTITAGLDMSKRVALLGAGFTRNWGGWLASELTGELCGRVDGDEDVIRRLKKARNFERVLGEIRQEANRGVTEQHRFERLQRAVLATFDEMNRMLAARTFEVNHQNSSRWVATFLSEFDVIFT